MNCQDQFTNCKLLPWSSLQPFLYRRLAKYVSRCLSSLQSCHCMCSVCQNVKRLICDFIAHWNIVFIQNLPEHRVSTICVQSSKNSFLHNFLWPSGCPWAILVQPSLPLVLRIVTRIIDMLMSQANCFLVGSSCFLGQMVRLEKSSVFKSLYQILTNYFHGIDSPFKIWFNITVFLP